MPQKGALLRRQRLEDLLLDVVADGTLGSSEALERQLEVGAVRSQRESREIEGSRPSLGPGHEPLDGPAVEPQAACAQQPVRLVGRHRKSARSEFEKLA